MARRPIVLSALQPGSLRDTVYVRAVLETTLPQIREQTASLRSEVEQGRALEREAARSLAALQASETDLQNRRNELAALMRQQQEASRSNSALARREAQRALALAEQARDLDQLVGELDRAGLVREELAALAGEVVDVALVGRDLISVLAPVFLTHPASVAGRAVVVHRRRLLEAVPGEQAPTGRSRDRAGTGGVGPGRRRSGIAKMTCY